MINRGKRSKTLNEVKQVENTSKNLQSFLEISPVQKKTFLHINCETMHMSTRITSEISTPPEIAVGMRFHICEHGTKTTPVFLPADGEASWSLVPSSVSLLSGSTVQPENTYSCILSQGDRSGLRKPKKDKHQTNHSYHQRSSPKPVSTDLTINPDSVLTNLTGNDGVRSWLM